MQNDIDPWSFVKKSYKIRKILGSGSYGDVFQAKHRETGLKYAIKHVKNIESEHHWRFMAREIEILHKLSKIQGNVFTAKLHEVIIPGEEAKFNELFLVMEYVSGDMKELLNNPKFLFEEEHVVIVLYNILCALNFCQSAGIVHRDLKPANILINSDCEIKLCDFGMARTFDLQAKKQRPMSKFVMTRWYRAPEVILLQDYDEKVDLWSIGCVLAELIKFTVQYREIEPDLDKRFLFPGKACFPISPAKDQEPNVIDRDDQIIKIARVIDISDENIRDENTSSYINEVARNTQKTSSIKKIFANSDPNLIAILEKLLEFSPENRPNIQNLIQSKIFDNIRDKNLENEAPEKIILESDRQKPSEINYRNIIIINSQGIQKKK